MQAVSLLRQRKLDDVVKSLNNLLAANRVGFLQLPCPFCFAKTAVHATLLHVLYMHVHCQPVWRAGARAADARMRQN